jgi:hypothetical protein
MNLAEQREIVKASKKVGAQELMLLILDSNFVGSSQDLTDAMYFIPLQSTYAQYGLKLTVGSFVFGPHL